MSASPILLALAGNPALLPEHVDVLIAMGDPALSRELAREQSLTPAQTDLLAGSGQRDILLALIESKNLAIERLPDDDPWALLAAIDRPDAPADLLLRLASWPDVAVRLALGARAWERPDVAQLVAGDDDCAVAALAACLWEVPAKLASRLSRRAEACVRVALASNLHAPGPVLADLIDHGGQPPLSPCPHWPDTVAALREVRRLAAANPATPVTAVEPLTAELEPVLALALASRADLPDKTYARLVALHDHEVTARVAINRAAPPDLLRELYDLDAGRWRNVVLANHRTPLDLLVRHSREGGSPQNYNHPDLDGLLTLAKHADPRVRLVAAASHRLPVDVRAALSEDTDFDVACRAVCHYTVAPEQVRSTAARHGPAMISRLAGHPSCPPDLLLAIATDPQSSAGAIADVALHETAPPAALAACLERPHAAEYIAGNPAAPPDMLIELAFHPEPEVILELARNPSVPAEAIHRIIERFAID